MRALSPFLLAVAVMTSGCAAVGLTLLGTGAGVAAGTGTSYTLDGIAYRTFTASLDETRSATMRTLRRMDMPVSADRTTEHGREIEATAGEIVAQTADSLDEVTALAPKSR